MCHIIKGYVLRVIQNYTTDDEALTYFLAQEPGFSKKRDTYGKINSRRKLRSITNEIAIVTIKARLEYINTAHTGSVT